MGRKSDQLRDELDLVEAERRALSRQVNDLLAENDVLRNQAAGVTTSAPRVPSTAWEQSAVALGKVLEKTGADPEALVRHAFETIPGEETQRAAREDLQAIEELHRPPPQLDKPESALDVVRANNAERSSLQDSARRNNQIISRVASALRVDQWDADGTQILEKAQQWASFAHWIKQRQKRAPSQEIANELATVLTALVAPSDLAKWIMTREESPGEQMPAVVLEVAQSPAGTDSRIEASVTKANLSKLLNVVIAARHINPTAGDGSEWLSLALMSERGTQELLNLLNLVLLPLLRRMKVVTG